MSSDFTYISRLKKADAVIQIFAFVGGPIYCFIEPRNFIYGVLAFAGIQSLSAIAWILFFTGSAPRMRRGTGIRRTFIIILAITGIAALIDPVGVVIVGIPMLIGGPICGILYFSATWAEIDFYKKQDTSTHGNGPEQDNKTIPTI